MDDLMIKIDNVKKQYRLGSIGGGTLQRDLQSWWARIRGKEDPNSLLGDQKSGVSDRFMALDGVSLEVRKGERVGIIGHNGAGKSTLLKLLSRVTAPTSGEIYLNGRISSMLEVGTGFNEDMTGRENVYVNGAILGMTKKEIDEKMDKIIEFSECGRFIDTPVKRYSSGMYVKLAFSVAANLDSEILVMDEVLAVGDMAFQKKCLDKMNEVSHQEGRTILYVSHNMNTIRELCDRCVVLDHGTVKFDGDVNEGISIYLNSAQSGETVDLDFDKIKHNESDCSFDIRMRRMRLYDRISPVYSDEETVKMRFDIDVKNPVDNVVFRFTLRTDDGYTIGTAWSEKIKFTQSGCAQVEMEFDTRHLSKGKYFVSLGFYRILEDDFYKSLDKVSDAFAFEISPVVVPGKVIWQTAYWGRTVYPKIAVNNIKQK